MSAHCSPLSTTTFHETFHDKGHFNTNDAYYIYGGNGTLYGNGK